MGAGKQKACAANCFRSSEYKRSLGGFAGFLSWGAPSGRFGRLRRLSRQFARRRQAGRVSCRKLDRLLGPLASSSLGGCLDRLHGRDIGKSRQAIGWRHIGLRRTIVASRSFFGCRARRHLLLTTLPTPCISLTPTAPLVSSAGRLLDRAGNTCFRGNRLRLFVR